MIFVDITMAAATGRKGTAKLNQFLQIEKEIQKKWEEECTFECDAPSTKDAK